jgi:hypothetical protein
MPRELIIGLDKQPYLFLLAGPEAHPHQMPTAFQPLAVQRDVEMTFLQSEPRVECRFPASSIPYNHCAAAILALRDVALEIEILHRVIFGAHGEALLACDEARPFGDGPTLERTV